MTLKNAVNELFDFAKAHECDLGIAYAKKAQKFWRESHRLYQAQIHNQNIPGVKSIGYK